MARFLPDSGLLIQHIPRTGGTWIEEALQLVDVRFDRWLSKQPSYLPKKHSLLNHYRRESLVTVKYVAAFVRHPIRYYESVWKWLNSSSEGDLRTICTRWNWHPHYSAAKLFHPDFDEWIQKMLVREPLWYTRLIEQYVGPEGGEFCDFIGRTEELADDFCLMMRTFGHGDLVEQHEEELTNKQPSNVRSDNVRWDRGLLRCVYDAETSVIRRFYYDADPDMETPKFFGKMAESCASEK